jgi:hypothetical protein
VRWINEKGDTMATGTHRDTAKIIEFPRNGRKPAGGYKEFEAVTETAAMQPSPAVCDAAFGGSWYHEEALREAEDALKH